jgi:hypothetical protein
MSADIYSSTLTTLAKVLKGLPFPTATFILEKDTLSLVGVFKQGNELSTDKLPGHINLNPDQLVNLLTDAERIINISDGATTNTELIELVTQLGAEEVAFLPIRSRDFIRGLVLVGSQKGLPLNNDALQPILHLNELAATLFNQAELVEKSEECNGESESLTAITNAIRTPWDTQAFFETIFGQITQNIGQFAFMSALYDEKISSINFPYVNENGSVRSIEAFPLGEGLTSILIRTKQPL